MNLKTYTFEQLADAYFKGYDRGKQHATQPVAPKGGTGESPERDSNSRIDHYASRLNDLAAAFNAHVTGECSGETGEWYYPVKGEQILYGDELLLNRAGDQWVPAKESIYTRIGTMWDYGRVRRKRNS